MWYQKWRMMSSKNLSKHFSGVGIVEKILPELFQGNWLYIYVKETFILHICLNSINRLITYLFSQILDTSWSSVSWIPLAKLRSCCSKNMPHRSYVALLLNSWKDILMRYANKHTFCCFFGWFFLYCSVLVIKWIIYRFKIQLTCLKLWRIWLENISISRVRWKG